METFSRLDLADAKKMIDGARAKAEELGLAMCIAVVDNGGYLIAFEKMDGGRELSTHLAQDKAFTSAIAKRPTVAINAVNVPGNLYHGINSALGGRFSTVGGGVPVMVDGAVVGAIGVSGGLPDQDNACAEAGVGHWAS